MSSQIAWTDETWEVTHGCTLVSPGCKHCYAARMVGTRLKHHPNYVGLSEQIGNRYQFAGAVRLNWGALEIPLHWKKPRRIFVDSRSDLFHEAVSAQFVAAVIHTMRNCPQHQFQILTKRPERMMQFFECTPDPPPNVWLGTSCETQKEADERIPFLLQTPAAVRFVSLEPLLGPIDLSQEMVFNECPGGFAHSAPLRMLKWVIVGGESGPGYRDCDVQWIIDIVSQCKRAGVPVFVKQDSGPVSGKQGRIPDEIWKLKEYPK